MEQLRRPLRSLSERSECFFAGGYGGVTATRELVCAPLRQSAASAALATGVKRGVCELCMPDVLRVFIISEDFTVSRFHGLVSLQDAFSYQMLPNRTHRAFELFSI